MEDREREPATSELEQEEVEAVELDAEELDEVAGGDPPHTHPDIPDVWPGGDPTP